MYAKLQNVSSKRSGFALRDITFEIPEGFITGLVGVNGAGKTTLFHLFMEEDASYTGQILLNDKDLKTHRRELLGEIGFVSEEQRFFRHFTGMENADLYGKVYPKYDRDEFIRLAKRMEVPIGREIAKLSRGEWMKFQLAFALSHGCTLLLLDEATAGMDPVFKKDFFKLLHEIIEKENVAIFMSTHIEDEVTHHMDYVIQLEEGSVVTWKESI